MNVYKLLKTLLLNQTTKTQKVYLNLLSKITINLLSEYLLTLQMTLLLRGFKFIKSSILLSEFLVPKRLTKSWN